MPSEDPIPATAGVAAEHPGSSSLPILLAPSTADRGKNTIRMELISVGCWKLEAIRFAFNSTFLLPATKREFDDLSALLRKHPAGLLTIFCSRGSGRQ
jgi:hypothetical protein